MKSIYTTIIGIDKKILINYILPSPTFSKVKIFNLED